MSKPVSIITGFLGAGKTTFLKEVLDRRRSVRYAIIENEFGEENIDSDLLVKSDNQLIGLSNGCLCCSLSDDLLDVLNELNQRREDFDELLIESTGIADPAGVARPLLSLVPLRRDFPLLRVICLVDPRLIEDQLRDTEEAARQIAFSDVILITKTDLCEPSWVERVRPLLAAINPFAKVLLGGKGAYPLDAIFTHSRRQAVSLPSPPPAAARPHFRHQQSDLVSLSFRFIEAFDELRLRHRLTGFLLFQSEGVYRIKGIIAVEGRDHRIIIQSVGNFLEFEQGEEWQAGEDRTSRVVFIGKRLRPEGFEKMLRECLPPAG